MPISLGRVGLLDRVGVDVLEQLKATVAVWRLEHGDVGVVAIEADGSVGPLATNRVTPENGQTEVGEEGDRRFKVADGDADVLEFDGHALHAIESGRFTDLLDAAHKFNLSDDDTLGPPAGLPQSSHPTLSCFPHLPAAGPRDGPTPQRETCPMGNPNRTPPNPSANKPRTSVVSHY
jgi:hypothetical protein